MQGVTLHGCVSSSWVVCAAFSAALCLQFLRQHMQLGGVSVVCVTLARVSEKVLMAVLTHCFMRCFLLTPFAVLLMCLLKFVTN